MENEMKMVKKMARCVQTLFEAEGVKVTTKNIAELIKDEDLSDIAHLKSVVTEHQSEHKLIYNHRRLNLKSFIVDNWAQIKDNDVLKEALFNAYCMGRYNKEKRLEMLTELLEGCDELPQP